ncbi:MAG: VOC family protein [Candidatus Eisenbacteria bacterium]
MNRLHSVVLVTSDLDRQREFYEQRLGLVPAHAEAGLVAFGTAGAALALQRADAGAPAEVRLTLTADALDARLELLRTRGVTVEVAPAATPLGRVAIVRDPEGNRVQLSEAAPTFAAATGPALSHAIVNAARFDETVAFYRELLGLKMAEEDGAWVVFDTGDTRLAVHDRDDATSLVLPAGQTVTFALEDGDFDAWADELRERGVVFAAAPGENVFGVQAEVEDADGWCVVLHGPAPDEEFDEDLVSSYEDEYGDDDDGGPRGPRRGVERGGDAARRTGLNPAKQARKQAAKSGGKSYEALQKGAAADTGGFVGRSRPSFGGPPRPFSPRPSGPGGAPGSPRPFTPRPSGPGGASGPSRPFTPRPPRPDRDRG